MTLTRIQSMQRPMAKGKHQRPQKRWAVRENPPYGQPWGQKTWPGPTTPVPFGIWNFETQTVTPPASGAIRMNNVNGSLVTHLFVSETLATGTDPIAGIANGEKVRLFYVGDTAMWIEFTVTAQTDAGAYRDYTVTYGSNSGGFVTPAAGEKVGLQEWSQPAAFDPGSTTIVNVQAYIDGLGDPNTPANQAEIQRVLDAEIAGQNRTTLVSWLQAKLNP